jgi:ATP-dependent DNA helicase RecG
VREALLNAVARRDYRFGGSVFVRQFPGRLGIVSPGGFPRDITPENIINQQNPRNRRLAEALAKCGLVERAGQELNLLVESAVRQSKPLPSVHGSASREVRLTLDAICHDRPLSEPMRARLPGLVDVGAVESVGRGRGVKHLLSRELYASLGRRGAYTRRRGLDHETNKALLLRHLVECAGVGAPMLELVQVLPALSRSHVKRLLGELSQEGKARLSGATKSARWFAVDAETIGSPL